METKSRSPANLVGTWAYEMRFNSNQERHCKALATELKREELAPSIVNAGQ
jgi:hypothetical protein